MEPEIVYHKITTKTELIILAKARLKEAQILFDAKQYDTATYLHDLLTLLKFSGVIEKVKNNFSLEWSIVKKWNPEIRYKPIGSHTRQMTQDMLTSTRVLMTALK